MGREGGAQETELAPATGTGPWLTKVRKTIDGTGRRFCAQGGLSDSAAGATGKPEEPCRLSVLPAFQFPSWYNRSGPRSSPPAVLPAFQFPSWYNCTRGLRALMRVLPAFQFPSWYNRVNLAYKRVIVLPAFQFPSWYNQNQQQAEGSAVLPAFQFPSWYN